GQDLKGKWQQRTFDFWQPGMNETPLIYESSLAWPALRRLHDAIRANDWNRAADAARWACGVFDGYCAWLGAIPELAGGRLPPGEYQPWKGLLLEREGKFAEAIADYRRWCGPEYVTCMFLDDLSARLPADERRKLHEQICALHHLACEEVFGAPQVALSD